MAVVRSLGSPPSPEALGEAADALRAGLVIALPTDTLYGLAADPFLPGAADRIFEAKKRPRDVELPVLVADVDQALTLCATELVSAAARRLMAAFWPGPLTLVLPRRPGLDADLGSDELTIGVRCPADVVVRTLCARVGPLAVTSANLHGTPTPADASEIAALFGDAVAVVLDGGRREGASSTVLDCTGDEVRVLRAGAVSGEQVFDLLARAEEP